LNYVDEIVYAIEEGNSFFNLKSKGNFSMYPEFMIAPFRAELTQLGVKECRTGEAVDAAVTNTDGTVMVIVNSVCGCAAGRARPGIALALQHSVKPESVVTVFAGADIEATERARKHFSGYAPSSPAVALLRNGKVVYMLERHQIENQEAPEIAQQLMAAFDKHCASVPVG
tara:strand:- start:1 stop:513 length:513 start_codon:yes stop_codon:yes gene_type:complete